MSTMTTHNRPAREGLGLEPIKNGTFPPPSGPVISLSAMTKGIPLPTPQTLLRKQIAETCVLGRYIIEALDIQQFEPSLREHAAASSLVTRILDVLQKQANGLYALAGSYPDIRRELQVQGAAMAGLFPGFVSKMRARALPAMLRNDHGLLNLAGTSYTVLHTMGVALRNFAVSSLALEHLEQLTPFVHEIAQMLPSLVVGDLKRVFGSLPPDTLEVACANTQPAWRHLPADCLPA
jgi:hypothetical protein